MKNLVQLSGAQVILFSTVIADCTGVFNPKKSGESSPVSNVTPTSPDPRQMLLSKGHSLEDSFHGNVDLAK
jgi:hypothetical protein